MWLFSNSQALLMPRGGEPSGTSDSGPLATQIFFFFSFLNLVIAPPLDRVSLHQQRRVRVTGEVAGCDISGTAASDSPAQRPLLDSVARPSAGPHGAIYIFHRRTILCQTPVRLARYAIARVEDLCSLRRGSERGCPARPATPLCESQLRA